MVKRINVALQGGGAHGAYTWGVLDRLLEDPEIEIAGISGTSAGALNAAALKVGLALEGPELARENLDWLWGQVSRLTDLSLPAWMGQFMPSTPQINAAIEASWPYAWGNFVSQFTSPYSWGPLYRNPLEPIVAQMNLDAICHPAGPALHICATNVRTGKIRLFSGANITPEAILASTCLPTMFQAVEIAEPDGTLEAYWDGGYSGNPALFPLFDQALPDDIVIVNINPLRRDELPHSPQEIMNRINEISFNASLLRELRAIRFVQRLIHDQRMPEGAMKRVLVHMISDDSLMNHLSVATKTVPSALLIGRLKEAGRASADRFLAEHKDDLNLRETVDLAEMYD